MEICVIEWIADEDSDGFEEAQCGGLGGWFGFKKSGQRWKDYIEIWKPVAVPYLEAIRKSVVKNKLKLTGEEHQRSGCGVPLFNDNTVASFSYRGWGDLMAAIWSEEENKDYSYMDFYM